VKRREFITLIGGAATWPLMARAQQRAMPVIGFLNSASPGPAAPLVTAFREAVARQGHVEGRNLAIEYRWAEGRYERLPGMAADLVNRKVALIAATGGVVTAKAAMSATLRPRCARISPQRARCHERARRCRWC